jgi:PadR family transcriptional regulator AphA
MLLRYAILGLLDGEEMHGYRMKSAFERRLGSLWSANFGQIYGSLKDLRRRGLVTGRLETGTGHLSRWTYTITAKGRRALATWLNRAPRRPEFVRDEIFIRLLGTIRNPDAGLAQLVNQERVYDAYLVELDERRQSLAQQPGIETLEQFVLDAMVLQVETHLRWLQQCGALLRRVGSAGEYPDEPPFASVSTRRAPTR